MTHDDFPKNAKDFFAFAKRNQAEMVDLKFVDMATVGASSARSPSSLTFARHCQLRGRQIGQTSAI